MIKILFEYIDGHKVIFEDETEELAMYKGIELTEQHGNITYYTEITPYDNFDYLGL